MTTESGIRIVPDDELQSVRGGKSFWDRVKGAAKWAKNHVVGGAKWICLKVRFRGGSADVSVIRMTAVSPLSRPLPRITVCDSILAAARARRCSTVTASIY